jgi:two-component system nitrogen regulation sensor histidine kinase NtrY
MQGRLEGISYNSRIEVASMIADPDLMSQAVINLLHNAVDAVTETRNPSIELACTREDGAIVISVTDNGRGIPVEFMDDVFVPFFTTRSGGSGIGLSIVRQIALRHGGQVQARANSVGGTTFKLALPDR